MNQKEKSSEQKCVMETEGSNTRLRKLDHVRICLQEDVDSKDNWLDDVTLIHQALPEMNSENLDTKVKFMNKELKLPLLIAGMTGGAEEVTEVNLALARVAEEKGLAFGLGSQRAMLEDPDLTKTYQVREVAPNILLFGNLGLTSLKDYDHNQIRDALKIVGVDALCIHLNVPQEFFQKDVESNLSWENSLELLKKARKICPIIAKEVGFGISKETAEKLKKAKVTAIDIGGYGGTNWIYIDGLRSGKDTSTFRRWGIPTAVSVLEAKKAGLPIIATGGIRNGLDIAKSIALGANLCGVALPFLKTFNIGGEKAVAKYVDKLERELKAAMFFTDSENINSLNKARYVLSGRLKNWIDQRVM